MKLFHRLPALAFISIALLCIAMKKQEEEKPAEQKISWGVFERQGVRPTMEDAYTHATLNLVPWAPTAHYFAIFDGHGQEGGAQAADYAAARATNYFATAYQENLANAATIQADIEVAFKKSYQRLDTEIQNQFPNAGTAGLSVLILGNECYLAWAGDSRAVVANAKGDIKARTVDHSPNQFEEKTRIIKAGAGITMHESPFGVIHRVGGLSMSRSIGDKITKAPLPANTIIAEPQIHKVLLEKGDFIILACDGLWDVTDNEDAVEYVGKYHKMRLEYLQTTFGDETRIPAREKTVRDGDDERLRLLANGLANQAYNKRSSDNISVMIIRVD